MKNFFKKEPKPYFGDESFGFWEDLFFTHAVSDDLGMFARKVVRPEAIIVGVELLFLLIFVGKLL